jgi:hypothetical protein
MMPQYLQTGEGREVRRAEKKVGWLEERVGSGGRGREEVIPRRQTADQARDDAAVPATCRVEELEAMATQEAGPR